MYGRVTPERFDALLQSHGRPTAKIFVPSDTTARSLGADESPQQSQPKPKARRDVEIVRNGSRGLFWLEPLVEVLVGGVRTPTAR